MNSFAVYAFLIGLPVLYWLYRTWQIISLLSRIDQAKSWDSTEGSLRWVYSPGEHQSGKKSFFKWLGSIFFGHHNTFLFVVFKVGDVNVGATTCSLFPKPTVSERIFARNLIRRSPDKVTVYYNPDWPSESTILPPSDHSLRGRIVSHSILTVVLTFSIILVLV